MKDSSDAIVIGAGPAGSFTALKLAQSGIDVTVCEEHRQIGIPVHCAGHISINGLKRLGMYPLPTNIVENTYTGAVFYSPVGNSFEVDLDSPITCSLNRALFDKFIAEKAQDAGAHYSLDSRVEKLKIEKDASNIVIVGEQNRIEQIRGKIIIDAEGISSRILRQIGLSTLNPRMLIKGVEAEVENVKDTRQDVVEVFLGAHYAPGFYAWLMPQKGGGAKIGLGASFGNPRELLTKLMTKHPKASERFRNARINHVAFHSITLGGPISKAYFSRFLAVGDVASQVKPTTGGGVVFGMTCAAMAAEVAKKAVELNDFSSDFLSSYQRRINETLGFDAKMMVTMRRMLDKVSDGRLDKLIAFCSRIGLDKTLRGIEEIDLQASALLRVMESPRVLAALGYFLFAYLFANP